LLRLGEKHPLLAAQAMLGRLLEFGPPRRGFGHWPIPSRSPGRLEPRVVINGRIWGKSQLLQSAHVRGRRRRGRSGAGEHALDQSLVDRLIRLFVLGDALSHWPPRRWRSPAPLLLARRGLPP